MNAEFLHTSLSLRFRFVIALFIYALAALLQVLLVRGVTIPLIVFRFAALALLFIPVWFLKARSFSSKPAIKRGSKSLPPEGIWRTVTVTELDRLRDQIKTIRKAKIPAMYNRTFGRALTFLSVVLLISAAVNAGATGVFVVLDLYLIFFPFLWFARVEKWYPAIGGKIKVFSPILEAELPGKFQLSPMLFFDGGEKAGGEQIPTDIRLMLAPGAGAPREIRDEFIGVQFQVTYNNGPNGKVPYMYAVFITRGTGGLWQLLKKVSASGFVTENDSSSEGDTVYGTVVLRLDTKSRSDGYCTYESDVEKLLHIVASELGKI